MLDSMPSKKSKLYDGPEFIVTREFFDRYFEKPMPSSTFHDLVDKARILHWPEMRGRYLLNASLHRMGLPTVDTLPHDVPKHSVENVLRLAFSLIDTTVFPLPSWLLSSDVIDAVEWDHARRLAVQHRDEVERCSSPEDKQCYLSGVLDAAYMLDADER